MRLTHDQIASGLRAQFDAALLMPKGAARWQVVERVVGAALEECGGITLAVSGSRYVRDADEVYQMMRRVYLDFELSQTSGPIILEVLQGGELEGVDAHVDPALSIWRDRMAGLLGPNDALPPAMVSRIIPADWGKLGRAAGPVRNGQMLAQADAWCGLWDGRVERCGTLDSAEQAAALGWIGWAVPRQEGKKGAWLYAVSPRVIEEGLA